MMVADMPTTRMERERGKITGNKIEIQNRQV
jgi:hypothetical protein